METSSGRSRDSLPDGRHARSLRPAYGKLEKTLNKYHLSAREFAVLELLSHGCSDKEIASALRVTPFTVNKHVGAILVKMNVRSRTAAAVHAIREHLFEDRAVLKALRPAG
jgi:DNA-binding NarL/FixJ family response regulator